MLEIISLPILITLGILLIILLVIIRNSIVIARGNEIIVLERKWFGKPMQEGRTVALKNEIGIQARILGPGFHFLIPFLYKTTKHKFLLIPKNKVGLIRSRTGNVMPTGSLMAEKVECDNFQDGELFLTKGGQKGPQLDVLPEGEYKINPHLFECVIADLITVEEDQVCCIESYAGEQVGRKGGNFGSPIECRNYQDAEAFLKNGGQKGPQIEFLLPGDYRINLFLFNAKKYNITVIPGGKMGLIEAMDGEQIEDGHLLGTKIEGHKNFFDGETFIKNGGQKGRQLQHLMPGKYRLNPELFVVKEIVDWIHIEADEVGIVTINEGKPILDDKKIAAKELDLNVHDHFQNASAFLKAGGEKGLQIPILKAGNYAINPWFASIERTLMTFIEMGFCGVVTSYVGDDGTDVTADDVNAKIVKVGFKGIWDEPLQPGKHPINIKTCKVTKVPTTQILLNWATNTNESHELDKNLSTITLRTQDAFAANMDVSVIIHIQMINAPKIVANQGSVPNLISQVLEPAISSHFRNAAQYINALDLYRKRSELQTTAKAHIQNVLAAHYVESKDTLIADVILPAELIKPVTERQIAAQEKETYEMQTKAQDERSLLEKATAQANMQPKVVESERNVEIEKNIADGKIKKAEGEKTSMIEVAKGESETIRVKAIAESEAITVRAKAEAGAKDAIGTVEAKIILAKGTSEAETAKLKVEAVTTEVYGKIQIIESIAKSNLKLIPETLIMGGAGTGNDLISSYLGVGLYEKLSGNKIE